MTRTRRWLGMGAAAAVLVATTWTAATIPAAAVPDSKNRTVLNDVHTDAVDVQYADGRLALKTRVGSAPYQFYEASDVIFQLRDAGRLAVPDVPEYAFLGPANSPVWIAPQVQDPSLLFAGWDTESVPTGVLAGDTVDLHLRGVTGPGKVEVFQTDGVGQPVRIFSSTDPLYTSRREAVGEGHHVHANWAFGAPGRYRLTFEVTAATITGAALSSGPVEYTWYVGGTNPQDVVADATTTTLTAAPATPGVTLTSAVTPANAPGWVEFFDGATSLGYSEVSGGTAALTTQALANGTHTLTAKFVPRYANDYQSSVSPPVSYEVVGGPTTTTTTTTTSRTTQPTSTTSGTQTTSQPTNSGTTTTTPTTTTTSCVPTTSRTGVVLDKGHVDYAARIVDGRLVSQVKDGTTGGTPQWRAPGQVVFHLGAAAATTVPSDAFSFLGPPSSRIWQIPQTQKPDVVWLGWNTEEITSAQATGEVKWQLTEVSGPGSMAIYELDPFGKPVVIFNSKDGLPDTYGIRLGTHAHGNWAFTASGAYRLTFTQSITLTSGATVTDKQVVTFAIGDMDPKTLLPTTTTGCGADGTTNSAAASRLASTGASIVPPLAVGAALVLLGGGLLFVLRRRRNES
ncbi:TIGR03773 family transporter-associated surface protein [Kibdelosporangium aridum]|nr:TIGR03773 family transporter-associated surface protein [Kibdelosporangium aridum]